MSTTIDVRDLPARFEEALRLAASGQEVLLADAGAPRARLVPVAEAGQRVPGLHAGAMQPADDFDAPLSDEFWVGRT
jgi:antitoxin (DNA-binding transcriptional repressor) of toxin-antitoxin stability system